MRVKCENCGAEKESQFEHDVCRRCNGSMHSKRSHIPTVRLPSMNALLKRMGEH